MPRAKVEKMVREVSMPAFTRPKSKLYQYNCKHCKHVIDLIDQKEVNDSQYYNNETIETVETGNNSISSSTRSPSSSRLSESSDDIDQFLVKSYTQQIKERNKIIVHGHHVLARPGLVEPPLTPIISSATNIRDYYIKELARLR